MAKLFNIALTFVLFAEFFLNGFHLLTQVVLALALLDAVLHFRLNFVAKLLDFKFFSQVLIDFLQPNSNIGRFERVLFIGSRERR